MKKLLLLLALALPAYTNGMDWLLMTRQKVNIEQTIQESNYPKFLEEFTTEYDVSRDIFDPENNTEKLQSYITAYKQNQNSDAYKLTKIPQKKLYQYAALAETAYKELLLNQINSTLKTNDNSTWLTGDQIRLILSGAVISTMPANPLLGLILLPVYIPFLALGTYSALNTIAAQNENNTSSTNSEHNDPVENARKIYMDLKQVVETKKNIIRIIANKDL
jgi:hypothetical protein